MKTKKKEPVRFCQYVKREGESCTLNNNCTYPVCPPPNEDHYGECDATVVDIED